MAVIMDDILTKCNTICLNVSVYMTLSEDWSLLLLAMSAFILFLICYCSHLHPQQGCNSQTLLRYCGSSIVCSFSLSIAITAKVNAHVSLQKILHENPTTISYLLMFNSLLVSRIKWVVFLCPRNFSGILSVPRSS